MWLPKHFVLKLIFLIAPNCKSASELQKNSVNGAMLILVHGKRSGGFPNWF